MNTYLNNVQTRQTAINGLAVVGFVALIAFGIWLAVYSTRFVPSVVNGIGSAAVYLGSVFVPSTKPSLSVVTTDTASTTIYFGNANSTIQTDVTTDPNTPVREKIVPMTAGTSTSNTYQISGATTTVALSGLPDFITNITAVGYLAATSTESFVSTSTVPSGGRAAIKFTIKNIGTNKTGSWRFSVSIPTQTSYIFQSQYQQSLAPGESIDYTLGFDQATAGSGKMISVTANFDRAIGESNTNNNSASVQLTILGS